MLGIVIGVGAVIALDSVGKGARAVLQAQIASLGTNVIYIWAGSTKVGGVRSGQGSAVTLTLADARELKKKIPLLTETAGARWYPTQMIYGNRNWNGTVNGTTPGYLIIRNWSFRSGGPFTRAELDSAAHMAVLGQTVVENLFEAWEEPVGATIRIQNVPFRVIGVLAPKGRSAQGYDQDDTVYIPFSTAERKVFGTTFRGSVAALFASTGRSEDMPEAVASIREVLRARHRLEPDEPDDFFIRTQMDAGQVQEATGETFTSMLLAVGSISLLVGGIGIMNILLVSVTERTGEIGLRKAVGAKRHHILVQFLIEAMSLSLAGGLLGIALGVLGARFITAFAGWPTIISAQSIGTAFFFSLEIRRAHV